MTTAERRTSHKVDGSTISVLEAGSGEKVVLAHGYLRDAEMWRPQIDALARHYHVVVPELWGHGASGPMPADTRNLRDLGRQHLALLDAMGIDRFALVGLSLGGMWGAELALAVPERVAALALVGTFLGVEPEAQQKQYFSLMDLIGKLGHVPPPALDAIVPLFFSPETEALRPHLLEEFRARLERWDGAKLAESVVPLGRLIFRRGDRLCDIAGVGVPTIVITGSGDRARPPAEGRMMAEIIGCPFVEMPGAGHTLPLETPDLMTGQILEFLSRISFAPPLARTAGQR